MENPGGIGAIVGGISGFITVLVFFWIHMRRGSQIRPGSKWGMNFSHDVRCPECNHSLLTRRRPKSFRQFMWGGWTCPGCGIELDKWLNRM